MVFCYISKNLSHKWGITLLFFEDLLRLTKNMEAIRMLSCLSSSLSNQKEQTQFTSARVGSPV